MVLRLATCLPLLLVLGMAAAASSMNGEMEQWQASWPWPEFPEHFIPCPLRGDQLTRMYYSLERVQETALQPGDPYYEQDAAMASFLADPPLTKKVQPGKRARMAGLGATSIAIRREELSKFVGFLVAFLHRLPNLQHVMRPQLVAKYMGFLQARGLEWSSMKKVGSGLLGASMWGTCGLPTGLMAALEWRPIHACHLAMQAANNLAGTVAFVTHRACPHAPVWSKEYIANVQDWYANLQNWLTQRTKANPHGRPPSSITLWRAWEASQAKWDRFKQAFEVRAAALAGLNGSHASPSTTLPLVVQEGGRRWTKGLARSCAKCVLRALMVGLHQPPMRLGSLQALHNCSSLEKPCVDCG